MAITTVYDGIEYRSRLEARWAAFMRNIGWEFVYEPFDGDGYIPDFLVQGPRPMLVEVKPAVTLAEYQAAVPKAEKGLAAHWSHDILIVGASPLPRGMTSQTRHENMSADVVKARKLLGSLGISYADGNLPAETAGILGQYDSGEAFADCLPEGERGWLWGGAIWDDTCTCVAFAVKHDEQGFDSRPCGCYDGSFGMLSRRNVLESFWADACNDVKWRGRAA